MGGPARARRQVAALRQTLAHVGAAAWTRPRVAPFEAALAARELAGDENSENQNAPRGAMNAAALPRAPLPSVPGLWPMCDR